MKIKTQTVNKLLGASIATLLITLGAQYSLLPGPQYKEANVLANWAHAPKNLAEADKLAESVIIGRVVNVRKGKDIVAKQPMEPNGEMRIPTEVVTIHVDNTLKGKAKSVVKLYRTGTSRYTEKPKQVPPEYASKANGRPITQIRPFTLEGDPEYVIGERYVLFLAKGPALEKDLQAVIAPEGRFKVDSSDTLIPVENRGLSKKLDGVSLAGFYDKYTQLTPASN